MRKKISSVLTFILLLNLTMLPNWISFGAPHELIEINVDVFINEDGSARITENRISNLSEGTENYIVINNPGGSEIIDFNVEEDGRVYDFLDNWDISSSREEKAFKNGIIYTSDGYELAWGIGEYGPHNVTLEYTLTNFVKNFQETQGIFWEFISKTNIPPQNASLVIRSDQSFNNDNSNIWAYGFEGSILFEEDKIVAKSSRALDSSDYLTVLVELEEPLFTSGSYVDMPFSEVQDMAFEGSSYSKNDYEDTSSEGISGFFFSLLPFLLPIFFIFVFIIGRKPSSKSRGRKAKKKFKEEYYRDYPYEGSIEDAFYILDRMDASSPEMLITAFILKWINSDWIDIRKEEVGFLFKKEETSFKFLMQSIEAGPVERTLYNMMREAAGSNEILEDNEFSKWSRKNYSRFQAWEKDSLEKSKDKLETLGYIEIIDRKILFINTYTVELTEKGQELEDNVYRFINYLSDFSIINEREAVNVALWDNLMIWAGLLGLTEVVNKEFKKLYPEYEVESHYRGNGIYTASIFANSATSSYSAAARSSGGGGFSSGGGGGGSFGGGGGGTR